MNCARKHTLVTGSSSGIGRATALRLAAAGQHVYAGVRKPADGDRLVRSAAGEGGEITPLILDVTEPGHIAAAAAAIDEHTASAGLAGLDGLVNNAGYGLACPSELVPLDAFRRQLDVNVTGQLAVTQAMLPALRRARGRIVMVSTIGVRALASCTRVPSAGCSRSWSAGRRMAVGPPGGAGMAASSAVTNPAAMTAARPR